MAEFMTNFRASDMLGGKPAVAPIAPKARVPKVSAPVVEVAPVEEVALVEVVETFSVEPELASEETLAPLED